MMFERSLPIPILAEARGAYRIRPLVNVSLDMVPSIHLTCPGPVTVPVNHGSSTLPLYSFEKRQIDTEEGHMYTHVLVSDHVGYASVNKKEQNIEIDRMIDR